MSPLPQAQDMGVRSSTHKRLFDRAYAAHQQRTGPIAGRIRSRTKATHAPSTPTLARRSPTQRTSGTFAPRPATPATLMGADQKLYRTRLKLQRHIDSDYRDDRGRLKPSVRDRYHQLGSLSPTGALPPTLLALYLSNWDSKYST